MLICLSDHLHKKILEDALAFVSPKTLVTELGTSMTHHDNYYLYGELFA